MTTLEPPPIPHSSQPEDATALERLALNRILASAHFAKAPLLSSFLRFAGEMALDHPEARITEQEIGVLVFHRAADYDPGEDNIVRNYARQLRRRLEAYYREEGSNDRIRIEIPKGGYSASFHHVDFTPSSHLHPSPHEPDETESTQQSATDSASQRSRWLRPAIATLAALLFFAAGTLIGRYITPKPPQSLLHPLWATLFQPDRETFIVPADIAYVILQQLDNRTYSLSEYLSWSRVEQYDHVYSSFLKAQKYTSMLDLEIVSRFQRLPEVIPSRLPSRLIARSPHAITIDDISNSNTILLGSTYSNPWVSLFEPRMNFRFKTLPQQGRSWIENTHPLAGESPTYEITTRNIAHETFAVVALVPNLSGSGHVLILEGIDGTGTLAAADLLLQGDAFKPILRQATHPDGRIGGFEVLIAATSIDSRATNPHIIAQRIAP